MNISICFRLNVKSSKKIPVLLSVRFKQIGISYYTFCMKNIVNNLNENHAGKNSYLFFSGGEAPCRALGSPQLINFLF